MKNEEIKYSIDTSVVKNYVDSINSIKLPMNEIKEQLNILSESMRGISDALNESMKPIKKLSEQLSESMKPFTEQLKNINVMNESIKNISIKYPNEQTKILTDAIKQIMDANNGILSTRMIEPLNISRQYLSIMENNNVIEKASRGIYLSPDAFEDSYFSFQQKVKKAVFSHMNALYFYGMTEEFPYTYTITVPNSYHAEDMNSKCNVFYVNDEIYELGLCDVETPNGNKVKAYDLERCICDIIRSRNRMDIEQVKKTIKEYVKRSDKDISKLTEYSEKMGISNQVMEMVGMYSE